MKKECGIPSDTLVHKAIHALNEERSGALLIVEAGKPVGILTDRNVVERCEDVGIDFMNTRVADLMCRDVQTVAIDHDFSEVLEGLRNAKSGFLAVVDEKGRAVGLVSYPDLIRLMGIELADIGDWNETAPVEFLDRAA